MFTIVVSCLTLVSVRVDAELKRDIYRMARVRFDLGEMTGSHLVLDASADTENSFNRMLMNISRLI
jgi:hypothetical protein